LDCQPFPVLLFSGKNKKKPLLLQGLLSLFHTGLADPSFLFIAMAADQVTSTGTNGSANHCALSLFASHNGAGTGTNRAANNGTFLPATPFALCSGFGKAS
jgi:hypothetical protein